MYTASVKTIGDRNGKIKTADGKITISLKRN